MVIKKVKGIIMTEAPFKPSLKPTEVIIRFTSDGLGETLSLSANDEVMITVAFEDVQKVIDEERRRS